MWGLNVPARIRVETAWPSCWVLDFGLPTWCCFRTSGSHLEHRWEMAKMLPPPSPHSPIVRRTLQQLADLRLGDCNVAPGVRVVDENVGPPGSLPIRPRVTSRALGRAARSPRFIVAIESRPTVDDRASDPTLQNKGRSPLAVSWVAPRRARRAARIAGRRELPTPGPHPRPSGRGRSGPASCSPA